MTIKNRSLLTLALIGTAVLAGFSAGRKTSRAKEKVLAAAAIDRWEGEGGSAPIPGRASNDAH